MIKASLEDITIKITDGKHGDCTPEENSGFFFVSCKDVNNGKIDYSNSRQITKDDFIEAHKRTMLEPDDILITNSGTIGRMALVKDIPETYRTTFQKSVAIVKPDKKKILPVYLYYRLQYCVSEFINCSNGSAQKNLLLGTMRNFKLDYPQSMEKQRRISNILSSYDDLIENNQKQIKLLEEAAQRLYKEWFVNLRFPGHENVKIIDGVPEGWEKLALGELISYEIGGGWGEESLIDNNEHEAYVIRGTDIDGLKKGELLSIPLRFHTASNLSSRRLKHGDIVFEVSGGSRTEGVARTARIVDSMLERWKVPVICASFCKLVRPLNEEISQYLFDHFRYLRGAKITEEFDKRSASSIVNYRWKDFLSQRTVLYPDSKVLEKYNGLSVPVYDKIIALSLQIESARLSRDMLLPKLMSGEIEL